MTYLTKFERAWAIAVSLASLICLAPWPWVRDFGLYDSTTFDVLFHVGTVNLWLLFGSCAVAGVVALAIALRSGLTPAAYSLAAGVAAWSTCIVGVMPPSFMPVDAVEIAVFITLFLIPWHAARFALHFPRELEVSTRLRRWVDSPVYPVAIALLDSLSMALPGPPAVLDFVAGWSGILLGASMVAIALHLLVRQHREADGEKRRKLRWVWAGAWGAVAILVPALGMFPLVNQPATMAYAFLLAGLGPLWLTACLGVTALRGDALVAA